MASIFYSVSLVIEIVAFKFSVLFLYLTLQLISWVPITVISVGVHSSIVALTGLLFELTEKSCRLRIKLPVVGMIVEPLYCNSKVSSESSSRL